VFYCSDFSSNCVLSSKQQVCQIKLLSWNHLSIRCFSPWLNIISDSLATNSKCINWILLDGQKVGRMKASFVLSICISYFVRVGKPKYSPVFFILVNNDSYLARKMGFFKFSYLFIHFLWKLFLMNWPYLRYQ